MNNNDNNNNDITLELKPTELLGIYVARVLRSGAYTMSVPAWSWRMFREDAVRIAGLIKDFGITDDMLSNLDRFKEILEKRY